MGGTFELMSSVVSKPRAEPPPELPVADTPITPSLKLYVPAIASAALLFLSITSARARCQVP